MRCFLVLVRELRGKYKQLARLMDMEQYDHFMSSLRKEQQLSYRIRELIQYRKNGITKHAGRQVYRVMVKVTRGYDLARLYRVRFPQAGILQHGDGRRGSEIL